MQLPKVKIEQKILLLFILVAIVPLLITNFVWLTISQNQILNNTSTLVREAASQGQLETSDFLKNKLVSLIVYSQTLPVRTKDIPNTTSELQNYIAQDPDIQDLILLDKNGNELVHVSRDKVYPVSQLKNDANDPSFKVPNFGGGEKYVSPVSIDAAGDQQVTLSIPIIISHNLPNIEDMNTSAIGTFRNSNEIAGVLEEKTELASLWKQLSTIKIDNSGYIYVVDENGKLIFSPKTPTANNASTVLNKKEVAAFVNSLPSTSSTPEPVANSVDNQGKQVLTTYSQVLLTQWGIIARVPISDALSSVRQVEIFGIVLFLVMLIFITIISLGLAKNITTPIHILAAGAKQFGQGNFQSKVLINTRDELEDLASTFNDMAKNLQQAFARLNESNKKIAFERNKADLVLYNMTEAIIALDEKRNIVLFNTVAEKLTGYSQQEAIGKPIESIISLYEQDKPITANVYAPETSSDTAPAASEMFSKLQIQLQTNRGHKLPVRLTSVILHKNESSDITYILTIHDLTEELNLEKMKLDFVSIAAHELRTPLTIIRNYMSVFREENIAKLNNEQNMFLDNISRGVEQLTFLINNILDVTNIEKHNIKLHPVSVNWVGLVKQTVTDISPTAKSRNIMLVFQDSPTDLPHVIADEMKIHEVLANLIDNAIKYTPEGGRVMVSLEKQDDKIITHVKDSGIGIPEDARSHLFTKFYRVSSELAAGAKGTGLGLYIAKSIVELHHGEIWVDSVEGKGSTFSFSLPADKV